MSTKNFWRRFTDINNWLGNCIPILKSIRERNGQLKWHAMKILLVVSQWQWSVLVVVRFLWILLHTSFLLKLPFLGQWWRQLALMELDRGEVPVQISQSWRRWTEDTGSSFHLLLEVAVGEKNKCMKKIAAHSIRNASYLASSLDFTKFPSCSFNAIFKYLRNCMYVPLAQSQHT